MIKNRNVRILVDVCVIIIGVVLLIFGIKDAVVKFKSSTVSDSVRFLKSYPDVKKEHIYDYVSLKEANEIITKKSGVILIGSPEDSWTRVLVKPLQDILKKRGIEKIYYLEKLENDDVSDLKVESQNVVSPHIIVVEEGTIVKEISKRDMIDEEYDGIPIEYFDSERIDKLDALLKKTSE